MDAAPCLSSSVRYSLLPHFPPALHFFSCIMYLLISFRKSAPLQHRQLDIFISNSERQVDDFVGELTFQDESINALCQIKHAVHQKCGRSTEQGANAKRGGNVAADDTSHSRTNTVQRPSPPSPPCVTSSSVAPRIGRTSPRAPPSSWIPTSNLVRNRIHPE